MSFHRRALAQLRALLARGRMAREMEDEMRAHLEQATARLIERGMSPRDAAIAARREFGNLPAVEEDARDARGVRWAESLVSDVRFALRYLRRKPVATTTIILVLALGIGANSALFSLLQSISTRPAPGMPEGDRVVQVYGVEQRKRGEYLERLQRRRFSYPELQRLAAHKEVFSAVAGHTGSIVTLRRRDVDRRDVGRRDVSAIFVTPGYFGTIGVAPVVGQVGQELDVVISHSLWEQLFAKSDTAIGSVVRLNEIDVRVVGVAPHRFIGPLAGDSPVSVWLPLSARARILNVSGPALTSPDSLIFTTFARLAPGVSARAATAAAQSVAVAANRLRASPDARDAVWGSRVFGLRSLEPMRIEEPDTPVIFGILWTVALLILLVACMNVSSLLVASAVSRRHEIAVRLSLGASRRRVVRQLVTESSILAVTGGLLALGLYWGLMRVIQRFVANVDLAPDVGTLLFTMAFAIGTGVLFGLSPALHATHGGFASAMRDAGMGATRRSRLQGHFVVAQIALTQPLLIALGVLLWFAIGDAQRFPAERVANRIVTLWFQIAGNPTTVAAREARIRELMDGLIREGQFSAAVPDARFASRRTVRVVPADRGTGARAEETIRLDVSGAAPGYLAMLEVPILLGRDVQLADTAGRDPAVVISSTLARAFWSDADPIGRRIERVGEDEGGTLPSTMVVVGIYDATAPTTAGSSTQVYTAHGSRWRKDLVLAKTVGPAAAVVPRLWERIRADAPEIPGFYVNSMANGNAEKRREASLAVAGVAAAGALAMLLASIGLYGVVALSVGQRRREIGVRIAVGGTPRRVAGMFFVSGVRLSAIGLAIGLPLSVVGLKIFLGMLPDTAANAPIIGAGVAVTVLMVASIATWLPARKAATVNPAESLRVE